MYHVYCSFISVEYYKGIVKAHDEVNYCLFSLLKLKEKDDIIKTKYRALVTNDNLDICN